MGTTSNWNNPFGTHSPPDDIANPYCCPTPPVSSEECRAGPADSMEYTQLIHAQCPNVYGYAYDDAVGLQTCPGDTVYTWTLFCPGGGGGGGGAPASEEAAPEGGDAGGAPPEGGDAA